MGSTSTLNLFGNATRVFLSLATTIFASRFLGAEDFGYLNLILSYTVFLHYILTFGFDSSLPFYVPRYLDAGKGYMARSALKFALQVCAVSSVVVIAAAALIMTSILDETSKPYIFNATLIMVAQTGAWALAHIIAGYLRGHKLFVESIVMDQLLFPITLFVGLAVFFQLADGVIAYALAYSLGSVLSFAYALKGLRKALATEPARPVGAHVSVSQKAEWLKFSLPLAVMTSFESIVTWITIVVAGWFLFAAEIGYLSVSIRATIFTQFLLIALQPIFSPYMSELHGKGQTQDLRQLYQTVNYWSSKWGLFVTFMLACSARPLLNIFGAEYVAASTVLLLILPGALFEACFGAVRMSLVMIGHSKVNMLNSGLTIFSILVLGTLLTPRYGITGIAIAYSLALILVNIVRAGQFYHYSKILPLNFRSARNSVIIGSFLAGLTWALYHFEFSDTSRVLLAAAIATPAFAYSFWKDRGLFFTRLRKKSA